MVRSGLKVRRTLCACAVVSLQIGRLHAVSSSGICKLWVGFAVWPLTSCIQHMVCAGWSGSLSSNITGYIRLHQKLSCAVMTANRRRCCVRQSLLLNRRVCLMTEQTVHNAFVCTGA
jgi:hypothetical protein